MGKKSPMNPRTDIPISSGTTVLPLRVFIFLVDVAGFERVVLPSPVHVSLPFLILAQPARATNARMSATFLMRSLYPLRRVGVRPLHYDSGMAELDSRIIEQLREIRDHVKGRPTLLSKRLSARGVGVLFAGSSGTGKTMAAKLLASKLGVDLIRVDLSTIVSKYIGETEKNLAALFDKAASSRSVLLFDEADALFGKRTDVKDAHDRYANIEVSYLLQRMEEYEGVAILATNRKRSIDEAFLRRLLCVVDFSGP